MTSVASAGGGILEQHAARVHGGERTLGRLIQRLALRGVLAPSPRQLDVMLRLRPCPLELRHPDASRAE